MVAPLAAGFANAQQQIADSNPAASGTLEVVTVTARRREENLQQVPIAVTALSGEELDQRRIDNLKGLQFAAPSLEVWPVLANNMTATISLRGQVEPDLVPTYDPAVGLYLDGVYIARATGANLELVDMERAEVLRGPQGTLFGRNSIGGAISLVSNKPTKQFEGSLSASIGDFSERDLTGVINIPFAGERSAMRLVVNHSEHAGYGRAILLHRALGDDDTNYVRARLLIEPADAWTLELSADMTRVRTGSQLITLAAARPPATSIPVLVGNPSDDLARYVDPDPMAVLDNRAGDFDGLVWGTSAVLTGEVRGLTFRSISAYRGLDNQSNNTDFDGTPYDLWAMLRRDQVEHQFSQELQASGQSKADRVQWTAGFVYFTEDGLLEARSIYLPQLYPGENWVRGTAYNDSWAFYAQAMAEITSNTRMTAGIRYNEDQRQLVSRNAFVEDGNVDCALSPEILDQPGTCRATLPKLKYSYVPYTLGLDYGATEDTLLYGKVSSGYRAGGFNMRGNTPLELLTFGPEEVTALEIGVKSDLLQRRLRINAALFESQYRDIQLGQFISDPELGTKIVKQNAGEARIWGGELEVTAMIGRLQLLASVGLTDGKFTKLEPDVEDVTLDSVLVAPKTTYAIAADLPIASGLGQFRIHADYFWRDTDTAGPDAYCRCDNAFGLLNAVLELNLDRAGVVLSLWGRNLTDERYWGQSVDSGPVMNAIPGDPRTLGMTVSYKFGMPHP